MVNKTNFKCYECQGKIIATEDFFIWRCKKCNSEYVVQVSFIPVVKPKIKKRKN